MVVRGVAAKLNSCRRAPLQAGEALLATVHPDRLTIGYRDIANRAEPGADAAAVTFFIYLESTVH